MNKIERERVYTATFANRSEDLTAQLDAMEQFALSWGADCKKCYTLRLAGGKNQRSPVPLSQL